MFKRVIGHPKPEIPAPKCRRLLPFLLFALSVHFTHASNIRASGDGPSPVQSSSGQQSPGTQNTTAVTSLEPGKPVENEISGGQAQSYLMTLSAGQFAGVIVQQRGIDVIEKVFAPDGKLVAQFDSELRPQEPESADFVAETSGVYRLEIKGKIRGAVGHYEIRVVEVRAATEQDRSLHEAHRLNTESATFFRAGNYDEALSLAARALDVAEKVLGPDHVYVAYLLDGLGNKQRLKGDSAKAEASLQRALAINQKALGPEHPQTVESLESLGLLYESKDDYGKAGPMMQQGLEVTERTLGREHPTVADWLIRLGALHSDLSDLEQAEREWRRGLAIAEKTLEPDDRIIGQALNNLGYLYLIKKDYERSEPFLQRALSIYEESFGAEHPFLSTPLLNLGRLYREKKDYARALEMYQRGLKIVEKTIGPESIDAAALINNIANIYKVRGDYAKALELYQQVLKTAEKVIGPYPYHGLKIVALGNIANLYAVLGDTANAITFQTRVDDSLEKALALNLAIGSERQKVAYFGSLTDRTDRTISLNVNIAPNDQRAAALAALVLLQRKGRILDAMSSSLTALRQRFDANDQKLLDQLNSTTAQLANLALNGAQKMDSDEYQKQLGNLEEQKEKLEIEISQRSAEFRTQSQPVTLAAVQAAIPPGAVLIEFASYRPYNPKAENNNEAYGNPHYVAYVVRERGGVQWKELGEAKPIDAFIGELRQALRDPQRNDVQRLARTVDEKVMQPVRALTGDATQLLISPDGELNLIPFAALVDEQGRYLIQRYSFTYLTSGRDLLRMQVARKAKSNPLVVANPSFGEPPNELLASTKPAAINRRRSVITGRDLSDVYFAPLGGTAQEARAIQMLFPNANVLTAAHATVAAVKRVNAPSVLHLATHGFFLSEPRAVATGSITQVTTPTSAKSEPRAVATGSIAQVTTPTFRSVPPAVATISAATTATRSINANARIANPLLRSGLALAGANLHSNNNDVGILTALEASGLNLWGTKLVVLSACDTGVGEVRNGEGVYGLRRAFVLAGAESLVMSLWPASDYTTRELMTNYYKNLKQGMGRGASLRQVQLDMLKRDPKLHPFYWANFIQSGEWANLEGRR